MIEKLASEDLSLLIGHVHEEWMQAEKCIKQAEQINNAVVIPAVKELRYAGRCLINALDLIMSGKNPEKAREYLIDAKLDCNRARHDAVDAMVSKIAIDLETIVLAVGPNAILKDFPDMPNIVEKLNSVRQRIVISRTKNVDRNGLYKKIEEEDVETLVAYMQNLKNSQKALKAMAHRQEFLQRLAYLFGFVGLSVGVVALIWLVRLSN